MWHSSTRTAGPPPGVAEWHADAAAFVLSVPGYPISGPVYGQFSVSLTSPTSVEINMSELDFGRPGVPKRVSDNARSALDDYLNAKIVEAGISIDRIELREAGILLQCHVA